jgi:hypothetical protein
MNRVLLFVVAVVFAACVQADPLSLTLIPTSGEVAGAPGAVVGWGFTLTDLTDDWVVLADSYVGGALNSGVYGSYVDYVSTQFYLAGPSPESSMLVVPWVQGAPGTGQGTGEFDIFATDPPDTLITGTINVDYDLFSVDPNDPNFDPDVDFIGSGTFTDTASVLVTPEPGSWLLLLSAILVPFVLAARRRKITGNI